MSMKYKRDIHMKFNVPGLFFAESVVYFLPLFICVFEHHKGMSPEKS